MPENKGTVAVTGANRGIGAAIALALAREGYRVACLTRSGGVPDAGADGALRARLAPMRCDVLDEAAVAAALARAAEGAGANVSPTISDETLCETVDWM